MTRLLDSSAAAERLGLAAQTLRKMRMRGQGPPFLRLGRRVRYAEPELEAWLKAQPRLTSTHDGFGAARQAAVRRSRKEKPARCVPTRRTSASR